MTHNSQTKSEASDKSISVHTPEKLENIKITDNISQISHEKIDNFIPNAVNPNNNAAFEEKNNPLSSKGN